ncbi:hypothetical protein F5Y06DRAFT_104889 [Hypoxylon sp. FL0890]|nr:hypothetical protein F5Y06DRAFT_104889 [Hypoxylon sp. FL0890]
MCLEVYIHNTCREHDTRLPCTLNPATGYTVLSPFQEPYPCQSCEYAHVCESVPPQQFCPYHPGCCELEGKVVCQFEESTCKVRVKYHHFVDKGNGETEDLSFLNAYLGFNPPLLFLAAWFFKAGVELALANVRRNQILERFSAAGGDDSDENNAAKRVELEVQLAHFSHVIACSREALDQFAVLWDLNAGIGALPPRPGCYPDPEQNATLSSELNLTVQGWNQRDVSQYGWPRQVELREEFKAGLLPIYDDPSIMCWEFIDSNQRTFTSLPTSSFSTFSHRSSPVEQIGSIFFNPGTPVVSLDGSVPIAASFSSSSSLSSPSSPDDVRDESDYDSNPSVSNTNDTNDNIDIADITDINGSDDTDETDEIDETDDTDDTDDTDNTEGTDDIDSTDDDDEDETFREYPIEAIVDHRPRSSTFSQVNWFKVRWAGDWPPRQKETWQRKWEIAPHIIAEYWEQNGGKNCKGARTMRRKRGRQQTGKY